MDQDGGPDDADGEDGPGGRDLASVLAEYCELALSCGWCTLDEWYSEAPNTPERGERGITIPRLLDLVGAYRRRHRREATTLGIAIAIAMNEPTKIDASMRDVVPDLEAPARAELVGKWW